jgi:cytoskeletal protein RodZ
MNRRTAIAIAAAAFTTLGTGAVTAAAMSGTDVLGLGNDRGRLDAVSVSTTTDDSPTSTRSTSSTTASTSTVPTSTVTTTSRPSDDRDERSTTTTTPSTTRPAAAVNPTTNSATFRSVGGEIDVTWTAQTLSIVAVRPAAGFRAESEEEDGDEVEAEFESETQKSKITVRLVDGVPSASVDERTGEDDRGGDDNTTTGNDNKGHGNDHEDDHGGKSGRG